ncbi:hypothetical protein QYF36_023266 [Acer negundo]|nr:hypothetical protein QYF36_023266 [Acer negundo]
MNKSERLAEAFDHGVPNVGGSIWETKEKGAMRESVMCRWDVAQKEMILPKIDSLLWLAFKNLEVNVQEGNIGYI